MDKLVIDASVVVKWFVVESYSSEARRLLDAYKDGTVSFHAPDLLVSELANTIWKKQVLQGLTATEAKDILSAFNSLQVILTPATELINSAYNLAVEHRRSIYDSLYLALSLREKCPLITADERFVNAMAPSYPQVVWVVNWSLPPLNEA